LIPRPKVWMSRQNTLLVHCFAYAKIEDHIKEDPDIKFQTVAPVKIISRNFIGNERCLANNEVNEDNLKGNSLLLSQSLINISPFADYAMK